MVFQSLLARQPRQHKLTISTRRYDYTPLFFRIVPAGRLQRKLPFSPPSTPGRGLAFPKRRKPSPRTKSVPSEEENSTRETGNFGQATPNKRIQLLVKTNYQLRSFDTLARAC